MIQPSRETHVKTVGHVAALVLLACALQPQAFAQSDADIAEAVRACQLVAELSARLACYDRAFPPIPVDTDDPGARATAAEIANPASAARAPATPPARPEQVRWEAARILEIEMPSLTTTVFHAEDGRVFVRDRATTVIQWPDTPVDVEVQTPLFGTSIYLKFPGARGPRVRVTVRD